jgi:hypothetical protein
MSTAHDEVMRLIREKDVLVVVYGQAKLGHPTLPSASSPTRAATPAPSVCARRPGRAESSRFKGITEHLAPGASAITGGLSTPDRPSPERDQWPIHVEEGQRTVNVVGHHRREPTAR